MSREQASTALRVGVDVGGTFTDVVVAGAAGAEPTVAKVASTPEDEARGVLAGLERSGADPGAVERFCHGTTVATNTVLERDGARTVLVVTAGFRDLLTIGRQDRPALYELSTDRPAPVVAPELVVEADERLGPGGEPVTELTDAEVRRVAAAVAELQPEAVAVSLLFAFADDTHERRLADGIRAAVGDGVPVSRSSGVLPVFREFERTSTTAMNAYVAPRTGTYLTALAGRLADRGMAASVEVMRSGGGTFAAALASRQPVHTLLSGPAAGAWGAAAAGRAAGLRDLIALDMGGTSTDVTLIASGRPRTTADGRIDGLPFAVSTTDIHTVGAGGGSIAWVDAGGSLRVGPRSAGAVPGPACYGRGGREPTVTDANLVLGHLDPDVRLGGHLSLEPARARQALAGLGDELGMDAQAAAAGVLRVVEAQMARALRVVSVERGHDPRRLSLVAFGGAGPLHQAALARELGVGSVLVPPSAGVLSALGLLAAPAAVEEVRTHLVAAPQATGGGLAAVLDELERAARQRFSQQHAPVRHTGRSADLRYAGQAFELTVPVGGGRPDVGELVAAFHRAHEDRYGYHQPDEPVEVVNLRVRLEGPTPQLPVAELPAGRGADRAELRRRRVHTGGGEVRDCPVYDRSRLGAGDRLTGPAAVIGVDATCWLAGWQQAEVDPAGNLVIEEAV